MPRALAWFALVAVTGIAGCAQNPITGRSQFLVVSEGEAISSSASAYREMIGDLARKKKIESGTARSERVRQIAGRLIEQAKRLRPEAASWKWEINVIDEPATVNAFAMAGGKIGIYTGMWQKLKATDDEIAQVLGHEIGHAIAGDTRERMSIALGVGIASTVAAVALSSRDRSQQDLALAGLAAAAALAITLPNSRSAESAADRTGIELAARAGYDPRAAVTLWEKMGREGASPPEFLSTHPPPENRRERLQALAADLEPVYREAKKRIPGDARN